MRSEGRIGPMRFTTEAIRVGVTEWIWEAPLDGGTANPSF